MKLSVEIDMIDIDIDVIDKEEEEETFTRLLPPKPCIPPALPPARF